MRKPCEALADSAGYQSPTGHVDEWTPMEKMTGSRRDQGEGGAQTLSSVLPGLLNWKPVFYICLYLTKLDVKQEHVLVQPSMGTSSLPLEEMEATFLFNR